MKKKKKSEETNLSKRRMNFAIKFFNQILKFDIKMAVNINAVLSDVRGIQGDNDWMSLLYSIRISDMVKNS